MCTHIIIIGRSIFSISLRNVFINTSDASISIAAKGRGCDAVKASLPYAITLVQSLYGVSNWRLKVIERSDIAIKSRKLCLDNKWYREDAANNTQLNFTFDPTPRDLLFERLVIITRSMNPVGCNNRYRWPPRRFIYVAVHFYKHRATELWKTRIISERIFRASTRYNRY